MGLWQTAFAATRLLLDGLLLFQECGGGARRGEGSIAAWAGVLESSAVFAEMFGGRRSPRGGGHGEGASATAGVVKLDTSTLSASARGAISRFHRLLLAALDRAASRRGARDARAREGDDEGAGEESNGIVSARDCRSVWTDRMSTGRGVLAVCARTVRCGAVACVWSCRGGRLIQAPDAQSAGAGAG